MISSYEHDEIDCDAHHMDARFIHRRKGTLLGARWPEKANSVPVPYVGPKMRQAPGGEGQFWHRPDVAVVKE